MSFYRCCCGDKQCVRHETAITANSTKFPTPQCFKKKENAGCGACSSLSPWPTDTVFLHLYLVPREIVALWLCICLISKISSGVLKIKLRSTLTPSYPPVVWLSQQSDANQLDQCWKSPKNFRRRDLSTNCNGFWKLKVGSRQWKGSDVQLHVCPSLWGASNVSHLMFPNAKHTVSLALVLHSFPHVDTLIKTLSKYQGVHYTSRQA